MSEIAIDSLLSKARNKFMLSNAAAGRARQIAEGSLPYIDNFDPTNPVITALREIAADKIRIRVLSGTSKKAQELLLAKKEEEAARPSALDRLAKEKKALPKKKEKKKKK